MRHVSYFAQPIPRCLARGPRSHRQNGGSGVVIRGPVPFASVPDMARERAAVTGSTKGFDHNPVFSLTELLASLCNAASSSETASHLSRRRRIEHRVAVTMLPTEALAPTRSFALLETFDLLPLPADGGDAKEQEAPLTAWATGSNASLTSMPLDAAGLLWRRLRAASAGGADRSERQQLATSTACMQKVRVRMHGCQVSLAY